MPSLNPLGPHRRKQQSDRRLLHKAAIAAGAKDNISPRARVEYYPGYYAADVFDPDGYTLKRFTRASPAGRANI
jgi:hypothetical protein